jgi:hypothetical protein
VLSTTGPESGALVLLIFFPLAAAVRALPMLFFRVRPDDVRHQLVHLAVAWPSTLLVGLMATYLLRRARAALDVAASSSHWYLAGYAALATTVLAVTAARTARTAREEARLRAEAAELLGSARVLGANLALSSAPSARDARLWLDEAQAALEAGRGRTAVRYLDHALEHAEQTAQFHAAQGVTAAVTPLDSLRRRVNEIADTSRLRSGG